MDLDILSEVLNNLAPVDIYKLSLTSKYYYKHIEVNKYIIKEIDIRLQNIFGDKVNHFKELLISLNAIISGSFIIQCILGEIWIRSDVDIFIPKTVDLKLDEFLLNIGCIQKYDNYNVKYLLFCEAVNYKMKSGQHIQLIKLHENNVKQYMNKTFDFDICKNIYNGKSVQINNMYNITHKIIDLKDVIMTDNIGERLEKYHQRGFNIINKHFMNLNDTQIYRTLECKVDKYNLVPIDIFNKYPYTSRLMCEQHCLFKFLFDKHEHIGHWKCDFCDQAYGGDPIDACYILLK